MLDHSTLVKLTYERFVALALAGTTNEVDDEVVVDPHGWSISRWMWAAGVGSASEGNPPPPPTPPLDKQTPGPLDTGLHNPLTVAEEAMRRMVREGLAEKLRFTNLYRVPVRAPDAAHASRV